MAKAKRTGRPSKYTPALADEIVTDIAQGVTLSEICRRDHMPDRSTVYDWMRNDEVLSQRIARARDQGFDAIADSCVSIADEVKPDAAEVAKARLRVETRLKLLAKWDPKRYGERVDHTSSDGSMSPKPTVIEFVAPDDPGED